MVLRADVSLVSSDLVLGSTLEAARDLDFEIEFQSTTDVIFVTVTSPDGAENRFERLEASMAEDPTVTEYQQSAATDDRRSYAVEIEVDRPLMSEVAGELGINVLSSRSRPGQRGWSLELAVSERESLVELRSFWTERDVDFSLQRLYRSDRSSGVDDFGLSERQRETLLVACREGYFDVPRGISQRELADELDASTTAVSQRIRRTVATLVANTIDQG
jgi:predicted DNA binding protein